MAFNQYTNGIIFKNKKQKIEHSIFSTLEPDFFCISFCIGACNSFHTPYQTKQFKLQEGLATTQLKIYCWVSSGMYNIWHRTPLAESQLGRH